MPVIRYPGSKAKLVKQITAQFPYEMSLPLWMDHNMWEYREPFFGAGAIGFSILRLLPPSCSAWLNDIDYGIICLWRAVRTELDNLYQMIDNFKPSIEAYEKFKREDGQKNLDPIRAGFQKLALHQMSYAGLGYMSGGPLGGQDQDNSKYPIDCRWNSSYLKGTIKDCHRILNRIPKLKITCDDFSQLIDGNQKAFLYLDPPYYEKGPQLYKHSMTEDDHVRLAKMLRGQSNWILSYDDHHHIRKLYDWAHVKQIEVQYTTAMIHGVQRPKNKEILISPQPFRGSKEA